MLLAIVLAGIGVVVADAREDERAPEPRLVLEPKRGYSFDDLAVSADGRLAAFAIGYGIGIADARRGKFLRFTKSPGGRASAPIDIAFAGPDGKWLVSRHERDHVRAWSTSSGTTRVKLAPTWKKGDTSTNFGARQFATSSVRPEVALAYWGGALEFVDLKRPRKRQRFSLSGGSYPHAMAFSPGGDRLALLHGGPRGTQVSVYTRAADDTGWSLAASFEDAVPDDASALARRVVGAWSHVAVTDDGATVFGAGSHVSGRQRPPKAAVLRAWDVETGTWRWNQERDGYHKAVLLAPGGQRLLVGFSDAAAFLDPSTGEKRRALPPHPDDHDAFALDASGDRVWAITYHIPRGRLIVWDVPLRAVTPR